MSNRSAHKPDGNKGFNRTQKKFVPKTETSSKDSISNLPLTSSLRQSSSKIEVSRRSDGAGGGASGSASTARVQMGENGNWVSRKHGGDFVNYLPQDEAVAAGLGVEDGGLDAVESQIVVDLLNRELSRLLKMSPREFWKKVASDSSLHEFLDSFLQFRNRWYDFPHHGVKGIVAGVIVGEFELSRRVFMAFYRISSNKDPGKRASDSLSAKEHEALVQEKKIFDLPKLLDICAIYGHENEELTRLLVTNAMKAHPSLLENLTTIMSHFLNIVHTMHQRCSSSLEALVSSGSRDNHGHSRLRSDFLEVMDFVNDAIASLDAFIDAYKPAAIYFSYPVETSYGNDELLSTLARLHDSLLPSLQQGFALIFNVRIEGEQKASDGLLSNIVLSLKMLSMRIVKFGWKLLDFCYLSEELFEGSLPLLTATKIFPAKIEDPGIRGDILVQTLREINEGVSFHFLENQSSGTFLQKIEKNCNILSRLDSLQSSGWIFMDDEQFQYLSRITLSSKVREKEQNVPNSLPQDKGQRDEDAAITESKISQIKDLFPDFGKGFLSACLEVYNQNAEEVIQRILDGSLHEDLSSLDSSLEKIPPPKLAPPISNDKGKGMLLEPATPSYSGVNVRVENKNINVPPSSSSYGRYTRKSKVDLPASKILDSRDTKDPLKSAVLASQYEYEDEYDDSFDDLGLSLVESGFEETESFGDRISSAPSKSWAAENENSTDSSSSRWKSRQKPQFYVKDGKNYSYKVSGSVAVSNAQEAAVVNQSQRELILGLGRGGNIPLEAVKALNDSSEQDHEQASDVEEVVGGNSNSRGRGRGRRGGGNNYRKDRAMKKHFAGLSGY